MLKTLKDLQNQDWSTHKEDKELVNAIFFDIRQEIIKWIEKLESINLSNISLFCLDCTEECEKGIGTKREKCKNHFVFNADYGANTFDSAILILKKIFNINKKELK